MAGPESRIQSAILKRLKQLGVFAFNIHGSEHMMAGLTDIVCCVDGQFLGIEVKTPQTLNNVSPRQAYVHSLIAASGGQVHVVASVSEVESIVAAMRAASSINAAT